MTLRDRIMLVAATLDVPWTVLAGLLWWKPSRMQGSPPTLRYCVYLAAVLLSLIAIAGAVS